MPSENILLAAGQSSDDPEALYAAQYAAKQAEREAMRAQVAEMKRNAEQGQPVFARGGKGGRGGRGGRGRGGGRSVLDRLGGGLEGGVAGAKRTKRF